MKGSRDQHESAELLPHRGIASKYLKIGQWILTSICVVWVVWYFYHNRQDLRLFVSLRPAVILGLLVLSAAHLSIYSLQFYLVLRHCARRSLPFIAFFKTIVLGRFLSHIAPQAGGVYRAVYLKHKFGISYTNYLGGFFGFLWIDAAMNILLSAVVFGIFAPTFRIGSFSIWPVLAAMTAGWFIPIGISRLLGRMSFSNHWAGRLHGYLSEMIDTVLYSISDRMLLIRIVGLNTLNFANNILIFYLCLSGTQGTITIPMLLVFYILLKISSYVILTPGNFGIREVAYAFLGQQMGLGVAEGMVLSVFYRLFGLIVVLLLGIYFGGLGVVRQDNKQQT